MSKRKSSPGNGKPAKAKVPPKPSRPPRDQPVALDVLNPNAAGIDVHSDMHMVCVPSDRFPSAAVEAGSLPANVRRYGANSCDLVAVADWLAECGITSVAMESTGVYWIPLFELLESRGFEVYLVEPGHCRVAALGPGRMCSTPSGFSGCTCTVYWNAHFARLIRSWRCVPITGNDRCKSVMRPAMFSTCKRPWSR